MRLVARVVLGEVAIGEAAQGMKHHMSALFSREEFSQRGLVREGKHGPIPSPAL
jgi:hypothetical protein